MVAEIILISRYQNVIVKRNKKLRLSGKGFWKKNILLHFVVPGYPVCRGK